ncbi:MAG TPA: hypothetical protein VGQ46_02285 [Thermoanaerobaculia bacterium]|nr:hypothetical protein [Thermoanaerobaculia bacterium]
MKDVWRNTRRCAVILADLTSRNSNVFYELGLAHAIGKPAVLISEALDDVPFDLRGLRVLLYDRSDPNWGVDLRKRISAALIETVADPVASVPTAFVDVKSDRRKYPMSQNERDLLQLKQDVESLKREALSSSYVGGRFDIGKTWPTSTAESWSKYAEMIDRVRVSPVVSVGDE